MRDLFEAIKVIISYIAVGMLWLANFGVIYLISVGLVGGPLWESKWTIGIGIYTCVVLGITCIFLWVESR